MAIDIASFKTEYTEFVDAPDTLVQAMLDRATRMCPTSVWSDGSLREDGIFLYTARYLALSPFGRNMKLTVAGGATNYDTDLKQLRRIVASGFRVL